MNNIDILEEKIKIIESLCTDDCINKETVIKPLKYAISNLIAENKELKEENEGLKTKLDTLIEKYKELKEEKDSLKKEVIHWKGEYHLENRKYLDLYNKKVSIPTINATEEMLEQYVEKVKIIKEIQELKNMKVDGEIFKTAVNYAIKILQSLLGKE